MSCSQCQQKSAMYQVAGHRLCLECYDLHEKVQQAEHARYVANMNNTYEEMEAITGVPMPRYRQPTPVIQQGGTQNFLSVQQGIINTGTVGVLNQSIQNISKVLPVELIELVSQFSNAVAKEEQLDKEFREEVLENLSFLLEQSKVPKEQQKKGLIKSALSTISSGINTSAALITIWDKVSTYFTSFNLF